MMVDVDVGADEVHERDLPHRPATRGECAAGRCPCPFVSCRHHFALDVNLETGTIRLHPGFELDEMADTCSLDVAGRDGITLEQAGAILGVTQERVRQVEGMGLRAIKLNSAHRRRLGL